jgi:ferric-dicitrate binding protein FerR (iron transport regulator)
MRAADPASRPTAAQVATELGTSQMLPTRALPAARRPRAAGRRSWRPKLLAAGAAAAILAAGAIALAGSQKQDRPKPVRRVPPASTAAGEARNLSAWLKQYSR